MQKMLISVYTNHLFTEYAFGTEDVYSKEYSVELPLNYKINSFTNVRYLVQEFDQFINGVISLDVASSNKYLVTPEGFSLADKTLDNLNKLFKSGTPFAQYFPEHTLTQIFNQFGLLQTTAGNNFYQARTNDIKSLNISKFNQATIREKWSTYAGFALTAGVMEGLTLLEVDVL